MKFPFQMCALMTCVLVACGGDDAGDAFEKAQWPSNTCCASTTPRIAGKNKTNLWGLFQSTGSGAATSVQHFDGSSWSVVDVPQVIDMSTPTALSNGTSLTTQSAGEDGVWIAGVDRETYASILVRAHVNGTIDDFSTQIDAPTVASAVQPEIRGENGGVFALFLDNASDPTHAVQLYRWNGTAFVAISLGAFPLGTKILGVVGPDEAYLSIPQGSLQDIKRYRNGFFTPVSASLSSAASVSMVMHNPYDIWFYATDGSSGGGVHGDGTEWSTFAVLDWPAGPPTFAGLFAVLGSGDGVSVFMSNGEGTYLANIGADGHAAGVGQVADAPSSLGSKSFVVLEDKTVLIFNGTDATDATLGNWSIGRVD